MAEYIEREAVVHHFMTTRRYLTKDLVMDAAYEISKFPVADVAPVVHGRWEEWWPPKHMILTGEEKLYRCSVCDAKYADKENMSYCPHCGARMDGN